MEERDARLQLLLHEMGAIQDGIHKMDDVSLQIKGWCVTVTLALAAASVTTFSKGLPLIGLVAVATFWFVEAHFKLIANIYIERDQALEEALASPSQVLDAITSQQLRIPGLATKFRYPDGVDNWRQGFRYEITGAFKQAREPLVFFLYTLMMAFLALVTGALHLAGAPWLQIPGA